MPPKKKRIRSIARANFQIFKLTPNVPFSPTDAKASHNPSIARFPVLTSTTDRVKFPSTGVAAAAVAKAPPLTSSAASLKIDLSAFESGKYPLVVLLSGRVRAITAVPASSADTAVAHRRRRRHEKTAVPPGMQGRILRFRFWTLTRATIGRRCLIGGRTEEFHAHQRFGGSSPRKTVSALRDPAPQDRQILSRPA